MFSEIDLEIIEQVCSQFKNDIEASIDKLLELENQHEFQ
jgi:hypothetical protein